ncbi:MAG: hypothetical protein JW837_02935, partial [Sedimentisphaerales bacterium]|nr:hypothetical protein [Sedimentisphaerales bacterium]
MAACLTKDVKSIERNIDVIRQQQQILKDSSSSLRNTINQLLETTEKFESADDVTQIIKQSQTAFLENQTKYEANNKQIAQLTEVLNNKKDELDTLNEIIKEKEKGAHNEFAKLRQNHRLKVAAIKLAFLLPVLIIASIFFMKKRSGPYWPLEHFKILCSGLGRCEDEAGKEDCTAILKY